jgi:glyoxylase-like metal-dependent hydrolase (beta-lactamase superfamily II)
VHGVSILPLPVADRWFKTERIDDALTLITEPHVDGWLQSNAWHLRGRDFDLLVDCGLGVASARRLLLDQVTSREPVVVLTHAHLDHMGSAHEFAEVWAHPAEPTGLPGRGTLIGADFFSVLGIDDDFEGDPVPEVLIDAIPEPGYDPARYRLEPVQPSRQLIDDDVIDLGDRRLRVLHLPGHTPGSIALYDVDARQLFTGDIVYDDALLDVGDGADVAAYIESMRRLLDLDVSTVHGGHAASFGPDRLHAIAHGYIAGRQGSRPDQGHDKGEA